MPDLTCVHVRQKTACSRMGFYVQKQTPTHPKTRLYFIQLLTIMIMIKQTVCQEAKDETNNNNNEKC